MDDINMTEFLARYEREKRGIATLCKDVTARPINLQMAELYAARLQPLRRDIGR